MLGIAGSLLASTGGVLLVLLGQTVYLAGFDRFLVGGIGMLTIVGSLVGAFAATLGLSRARVGAFLLFAAAASAVLPAGWFAVSASPVVAVQARGVRTGERTDELRFAQAATLLLTLSGTLFLASAGTHAGKRASTAGRS